MANGKKGKKTQLLGKTFKEITTHAPMMMSLTVGRSRDFRPQSRASSQKGVRA
jgi:hypothetical protein